ncbi:hypothetical protein ACTFIW_012615 [Dictyostelium discoideum]
MKINNIIKLFIIIVLISIINSQEYLQPPQWWNERVEAGNLLSISNGEQEPTNYLMTNVGNGYVAFVIGGESIYVGGVYNGPAINLGDANNLPSHRAGIPNFQNIEISNAQFQYAGLDIENATYTRVYSIPSSPGTIVKQIFYAHQKIRNILVQEIEVDNSNIDSTDVTLQLSVVGINLTANVDFNILNLTNTQFTGNDYQLYNLTIKVPEVNFMTTVAVTTTTVPQSITIKSGEKKKHHYVTSFLTNIETNDYIEGSLDIYKTTFLLADQLIKSHLDEWNKIWKSGIEVGGDSHLQQVVNSSLYYLFSSIRDDWSYGMSPGGLASDGYNGHSFWDTETWMLPPILLLNPKLVRDCLLQYRINNLPGAHEKALSYKSNNYTGFMFPWESAFTGIEVCPTFAPTGILEQHITADIALAIRQYYYLTGDLDWLVDFGYKALKGIAEFWASRVEYDQLNQQYSINTIIPPDEYAVGVNNSVYTNVAVKMTFEWVIEVATLINDTENIPFEHWSSIANGLVILFDEVSQWHPEYQGYNGETIKQADVVLLGFPLMYNMSKEVRKNDLIYYEAVTTNSGPAMTYSMHTVAWLELENLENATKQWFRSYNNCNNSPFLVWTETPTGGAVNFATGMGGFLQGLMFGYGGVRIHQGNLDFYPQLPEGTTSLKIRSMNYIGSTFNVGWNQTTITFEMLTFNPSVYLTLLSTEYDNIILNTLDPIYLTFGSKFQIYFNNNN